MPRLIQARLRHHPGAILPQETPGAAPPLQPVVREGYSHITMFKPFVGRCPYDLVVRPDDDAREDYNLPPMGNEVPAPDFYQKSVLELDVHFLASHGRLLLGRNRKAFFLCCPEDDAWVSIPLPSTMIKDPACSRSTAAGLRYSMDTATGLDFTVVLLVPVDSGGVAVESFSSAEGAWSTTFLQHEAAAACLLRAGGVAPGIYTGGAYFWVNRGRPGSRDAREVLSYAYNPLELGGHLSVIAEPPLVDGFTVRVAASPSSSSSSKSSCVRGCWSS